MDEKYIPLGKPKFKSFKVYLAQTDSTGIVYYAKYLEWMEAARMDFLEEVIAPFEEILRQNLTIMPIKVNCEYKRPCLLGDMIEVETKVVELGLTTVTLSNIFTKPDATGKKILMAEGQVTLVFLDTLRKRPTKVPEFAVEKLKVFEIS
jgi:acyl-CoA thioester hydrolase